ncbi:exocyst complex component Sec10-domain-containing protein [Trichophaea hybrida]|nr:exocyst complex component Sec10-domain-containing protein [Trichophaea hybrida]
MPPKRQSLRPPSMRLTATPLPGMNKTRSVLPAEIIASILDYLPVRDLMAFARVSHRLQEMVYDDTRWVRKLQLMGVWNEAEARKRFEEAMRRKRASEAAKRSEEERKFAESRKSTPAATTAGRGSTIFDIAEEREKKNKATAAAAAGGGGGVAGINRRIDLMSMSGGIPGEALRPPLTNRKSLLTVIKSIRSIRGFARQEYGRIYGALSPLYLDLVRARTHTDPVVFQMYRDPEEQAQMLAQLRTFSDSDTALGWAERTDRLKAMMGVFENAALREFEGGYESGDIDGRMRRYAHVLITLNGGGPCIQLFVQKHPVLYEKEELGNPMDCFDNPEKGAFSLEPAKVFWEKLAKVLQDQADVIDRVFPPTVKVLLPFLERVAEDVISEYVTPILDETHERDLEQYLKAVTGLLKQSLDFGESLEPGKNSSSEDFTQDVIHVLTRVFDPHVDLYLQDELDHVKKKFNNEVETWEKRIQEQDAATESFFRSNINREADKRDFLSTFKKVILAPVSVIPSAFTTTKPTETKAAAASEGSPYAADGDPNRLSAMSDDFQTRNSSRLSVASGITNTTTSGRASPAPSVLPTTELAAKAAIMNTRLEGIRSLFSLDVALKLVHMAKESLERSRIFTKVGGQNGEEAREQCESIFVALLQVLGPRHVKSGFDKAISHLRSYDPRSISTHSPNQGVAPLVTFLELVNIGDLIAQMLEVFYETELVALKLTDRHDFLNPATKEKKRFEQMLDERVAAGLNVGLDVLIAEVEHIFATTQQVTDFNPGALETVGVASGETQQTRTQTQTQQQQHQDVGPSQTAVRIISLVESHTKLLVGSTDKNVLDVFNQEVGIRLFASICKHIKRQRISVDGAIRLISDMNHYHAYIITLKLRPLVPYFSALRELAQIYLISPGHAKQMATVMADPARFGGIFRTEEVYEYAARREDWYRVKKDVERAMYGIGCAVM